jgi:FixJ family two-component response regulator
MRKSLVRLLQAHEYSTAEFASAEEFLGSGVAGSAIGLVLDIHLGGMSGIELRRQLVADGSQLPVVFITAFDDDTTRAEATALGCVAYLKKPFETGRLIGALEPSK